jgi:hypothetical protein
MTKQVKFGDEQFRLEGFIEVSSEDGMTSAAQFTGGCSGGRSACCTRVCSSDPTFVGSAQDWEAFLAIKGGEIQY